MTVIEKKPDMSHGIWAEDGNVEAPSEGKVKEGWVVEKPLNEYMNWIMNRQDRMLQYLNQQGIAGWDENTTYPINAFVSRDGIVYKSLSQNFDKDPTLHSNIWQIAFSTYQDVDGIKSEVDKIKNNDGYLTKYVMTKQPVLLAEARGIAYNNATNASGYGFSENTPTVKNDGDIVAKFSKILLRDDDSKNVATTEWVKDLLRALGDIYAPVGSVFAMASRVAPDGYLECNGNSVSRTQYAKLFDVIGTTFGAGDNARTFNLPDLRGEFIRGFDNGRGFDPSRNFGSHQEDAIRNIVGSINGYAINSNETFEGTGAIRTKPFGGHGNYTSNSGQHGNWDFDASRVVPTANENRPKNTALMYVIKY